jgi:cation:H+ antiporter
LPELASSLSAALAGSSGLVIGNVVGSNIANIGLVLGVGAAVRPFATAPRMYDRDGYILLASTLAFFAVSLDNRIDRADATLFLVTYVAYVVFVARSDRAGIELRFRDFLKFVFDFEYAAPLARRLTRRSRDPRPAESTEKRGLGGEGPAMALEAGVVVLSLVALIVSARYVVAEAVWTAQLLSLPDNLIGLSLVAMGTSLPELLVSVAAARKGKAELIIGNVMGSNIANTLLVVGAAATVHPLDVAELSVVYTVPIMLFFSLGLLYFIRSNWRISRTQGALAVVAYVVFLATAFFQGWE